MALRVTLLIFALCAVDCFSSLIKGAYAQRAVVDEKYLVGCPDSATLKDMASLPLVGCTVIQALRPVLKAFNNNVTGKKILIQAGSGGVGTFAVQYCSNVLGMYVTTTTSAKNFILLKGLGAKEVIDYKTEKIEDRVQIYDVFLDIGNISETVVQGSKVLRTTGLPPSHYIQIAASPYDAESLKTFGTDPLGLTIPECRIDRVATGLVKEFVSSFGLISSFIHFLSNQMKMRLKKLSVLLTQRR